MKPSIFSTAQERILTRLAEIESENQIKIAYACESGSRAWGFPSQNSDYDVRFIYIRPLEWYLSIEVGRDVIELPIDGGLDINGWDLKKALQLLSETNPTLFEWLGSPIIYLDRYDISEKMREMAETYYSKSAYLQHYLKIARGNYLDYLQGDTVWIKKYLYVLRPLMALKWVESGFGFAPTDFNIMVEKLNLPSSVRDVIHRLLENKRSGDELGMGDRIPVISDFIRGEFAHWENTKLLEHPPITNKPDLDGFFRESIRKAWMNKLGI